MILSLNECLMEVQTQHHRLTRQIQLLRWLNRWLICLLLILLFDAAWSLIGAAISDDPFIIYELPLALRIGLSIFAWLGLFGLIYTHRLPCTIKSMSKDDYALWVEQQTNLRKNPLINAVQLNRSDAVASDTLTQSLVTRVNEQADQLIKQFNVDTLFDRRLLKRYRKSFLCIVCIMLLWVILAMVFIRPSAPWLSIVRIAIPLGDFPPISQLAFDVTVQPTPVIKGDSANIKITTNRPVYRNLRLMILNPTGQTLAVHYSKQINKTNDDHQGNRVFKFQIKYIQQPIRLVVQADSSRSRIVQLEPVALPKITNVQFNLITPEISRPIALQLPGDGLFRGLVGTKLMVTIQSDQTDSHIDHDSAVNQTMIIPLTSTKQSFDLHLVNRAGLKSKEAVTFSVVGLTQAQIAQLQADAGDASITLSQTFQTDKITTGTPADSSDTNTTNSSQKPTELTSNQSNKSTTGHSPDTTGSGGNQQTNDPQIETLATGDIVRSALANPQLPDDLRQMTNKAPRSYRELVARYFLKINNDQKGTSP